MSNQPKQITRDELYQALWQTPMSKLATTWNVSIPSIVKACAAMKVPRPGPGHWQLIARGWTIEREPLPGGDAETVRELVLGAEREKPAKSRESARPTETAPAIVIASDVQEMHELVRALQAKMKNAPILEGGPVEVAAEGNFSVWVSKAQLRRALFFLDAIVKAVEKRGATFVMESPFNKHLVAKFGAGIVEFQIVEPMQHKCVPTKRDPLPLGGYYQHHDWKYFPTGKLRFSINGYYPTGVRKNWNDGKRHRVEDYLKDIVDCMVRYPELGQAQREKEQKERDERNRIWHEAYLRRSAPERLKKMRAEMRQEIEAQGQAWSRALAIRAFLHQREAELRTEAAGGVIYTKN